MQDNDKEIVDDTNHSEESHPEGGHKPHKKSHASKFNKHHRGENKGGHQEESLKEEVDKLTAEIGELKSSLLRALAENDNVRKRFEKQLEDSRKFAVTELAKGLVEGIENLYRTLETIEKQDSAPMLQSIAQGVEMTLQLFIKTLERNDIKRINPLGELFDYNYHESISYMESADHENNTIIAVVQPGYMIHGRLLRPAMVVVAKNSPE
jgi:molecular chaperone GrpE